jgi:hypothetical protein
MADSKAFGDDQQVGTARAFGGGSGFIAPVRSGGASDLIEGLNKLGKGIGSAMEDENLTGLGEYIATGRDSIRTITNPVLRAQTTEKLVQGALKRFGAKHESKILNGLKNPETKVTYDPSTGEKVTEQWDGSITREPLPKQNVQTEIANHHTSQYGHLQANAPNLARVADNIMGNITDKNGQPMVNSHGEQTDVQIVAGAVNDHFGTMQRVATNLSVIKHNNPFYDDKISKQGLAQIEMNFDRVVNSFMSDRLANLVMDDRIPGVNPEVMIKMFDAFVIDHDKALNEFGPSMNITPEDVKRMSDAKKSARDRILKAYEGATKGGLEQFKREVEKSEQQEKLFKSEWFNKLPAQQKELVMRAPTMQAMSTAMLTYKTFVTNFGSASATEQRMAIAQMEYLAPVMQYNMADAHMGIIREGKLGTINEAPERAQLLIDSTRIVLDSSLGNAHFPEIYKKYQELRGAFDGLVKEGRFKKEDVDKLYQQLEKRKEAIKQSNKMSGVSEEEATKANGGLLGMLKELMGGVGSAFSTKTNPIPRPSPLP